MSAVRRHLVAILAVVLGLAVGIVLGAGPLSNGAPGEPATSEPDQETSATPDVDGDAATLGDELLRATATRAYADALDRTPVTVLVLPGVDAAAVAGASEEIERAGGVPATVTLAEGLLDPGQRTLVDTLGRQLTEQVADLEVDAETPTYELFGRLLGRAAATRDPAGEAPDADAESVLVSAETAELLDAPDELRRAPYTLVLMPADSAENVDPIVTGLVRGLAEEARGTVVLAPAADPALTRLRAGTGEDGAWNRVTTVDADPSPAGWVAATLALVGMPDTRGGSYGATGADGTAWMD